MANCDLTITFNFTFVNIRPHSSAHPTRNALYIVKSAWYPAVHTVETGYDDLVVLALVGRCGDIVFVPANLGRSSGPWWSDVTARAGYATTTTTTFSCDCPHS